MVNNNVMSFDLKKVILSVLEEDLKIINEISSKYVDAVKDAVKDKELPFNNIFGNKLRLKIPIKGTEMYGEILQQISKIKNFDHFDAQKKEVVKKIQLDPKYGGGTKYQKINLGKAISSLSLPEEQKKKMLDWFANYSSNIKEIEETGKYTIVLSRSPIDVLRMSDVGAIRSCHSQGGQYFQCAIQEAKTGGPIAYVVKTEELKGLSEEQFQYDEIFKDEERKIDGISAISRLRVRRYKNKENPEMSIGVPETRIYGNKVEGFYSTLNDFLKEKQFLDDSSKINISPAILGQQFKDRKWIRTGGSYSDSSDSSIFNQMLDTDIFYGSLSHEEGDEGQENEDRARQFEDELSAMKNAVTLKHFTCYYDVDDNGENYVYYNAGGGCKIDLGEMNLEITQDFLDIIDSIGDPYEFSTIRNYSPEANNEYRRRVPYGFTNKVPLLNRFSKFLKDFEEYDVSRMVQDSLSLMHSGRHSGRDKNVILFECGFGDEEFNGYSENTDTFRSFVQELEGYDQNYEKIVKAFVGALKMNGFVKNFNVADTVSEEKLSQDLKSFEFDGDNVMEYNKPIALTKFKGDAGNVNYQKITNETFQNQFSIFLQNYLNAHYKKQNQTNAQQMSFKGFLESLQTKKNLFEYDINVITSYSMEKAYGYGVTPEGQREVNFKLNISFDDVLTKELYDLLMFLDQHIDDLVNAARYIVFYKIFGIRSNDTNNLQKVFGKYFI